MKQMIELSVFKFSTVITTSMNQYCHWEKVDVAESLVQATNSMEKPQVDVPRKTQPSFNRSLHPICNACALHMSGHMVLQIIYLEAVGQNMQDPPFPSISNRQSRPKNTEVGQIQSEHLARQAMYLKLKSRMHCILNEVPESDDSTDNSSCMTFLKRIKPLHKHLGYALLSAPISLHLPDYQQSRLIEIWNLTPSPPLPPLCANIDCAFQDAGSIVEFGSLDLILQYLKPQ